MTVLVEAGLANAAVALALSVVALGVGLFCRRPAILHALWLLVLLKLVTPPLIRIPVPLPARAAETVASEEAPAEESAVADVAVAEADPGREAPEFDPGEALPLELVEVEPQAPGLDDLATASATATTLPVTETIDWLGRLAWLWLAGSAAWFLLAALRLWRFGRLLRLGRAAPPQLVSRVARLARRMGLTRCPAVRVVSGRLSPLVWGVGQPVIVVPEGLEANIGPSGLDTLLLHELAHLRRHDHWVRWVEFLVLGCYWWFPVVWYARRELREAEEQCCDAWVVQALPGSGRLYATALVDALDFLSPPEPRLPPLASGLGGVADLKRRLIMILGNSTSPAMGRLASLSFFGFAAFLLPLVPGLGQAQERREERREVIVAAAAPEEVERLEAEMRRKSAEIEELKRRIEAHRQKKVKEIKVVVEDAKKHAHDAIRAHIAQATVVAGGPTIRIEISGVGGKPEEIEKLVEKLKAALPEKHGKVIVLRGEKGFAWTHTPGEPGKAPKEARSLQFRFAPQGHAPTPATPSRPGDPAAAPVPPRPPMPGLGGMGMGMNMGGPDRRIDGLEKKLDSVLRELESLRQELRKPTPTPPGPRGGPGFGRGREERPGRVIEGEGEGRPRPSIRDRENPKPRDPR